MAIVPLERSVLPGVASAPRRRTAASGEDFGAIQARETRGLVSAVSGAAQDFIKAEKESQRVRDRSQVRNALNSARSRAREYMSTVYSKKGEDAIEVIPDTEDTLLKIREEAIRGLAEPVQKDMFMASYDSLMNGHLDRANAFQDKSRIEFEEATITAENNNAIEDALAAYTDPLAIKEAEATLEANTRFLSRGFGKEISDKRVEDALFNLHQQVLSSVSKDSPEAALGYLEENWDKFNPKLRTGLKKELAEKASQAWVQRTATAMDSSQLPLDEQLKAVDKVKDPKRAAALRRVVKDRDAEKERIKKYESRQKINAESDQVYKDPFAYRLDVTRFTSEEQDYLYNLQQRLKADKLAERGGGVATKSDPDTYMRLMSMPLAELREDDLKKYVGLLSSTDFKRVFERQRSGDKTVPQMQILKTAVGGIKDFDTRRKKKGKPRVKGASELMAKLITEFQKQLALIPVDEQTYERVHDMIYRELLTPVATDTGWRDGLSDKTLYRFEVPYLEEEREQKIAYEQNIPVKLKQFKNVQFDKPSNRYYVDGDGVRDIYNEYGDYIKSYRKINERTNP